MRLHFLKLDRGFFCLQPSLARLYSAAASPSERLRSDGSLAINACSSCKVKLYMLISITIILLLNFEKNISYVFLFLRNFKISFPSVFTVYFVLFQREKEKTLQLASINFVYIGGFRICDALRESLWRVEPEKQSLNQYNATISKYINLILLCYIKFIPL